MRTPLGRVSVVAMLALSGCSNALPYRWFDADLGAEVHSDFEQVMATSMFDADLRTRCVKLRELFEVESLADLRIVVHDKARWTLDDGRVLGGWHGSGEIHVMAGWDLETDIGVPTIAAEGTLLHEFVHALVARRNLTLPRWFEEGLCEVLSGSPVVTDGSLVWMPNGKREASARQLRANGEWMTFEQLTSYVDRYPDNQKEGVLLYAAATSFVWSLVKAAPPADPAGIAAIAGLRDDEMRRRFAAWEDAFDATSMATLYRPFLSHPDEGVRVAAVEVMGRAPDDDEWWQDVTRMLADPSQSVRGSMRIRSVSRPPLGETALRHYRAWRDSDDRHLQLSGLLAAGQAGDLDAGIRFCRSLTAADHEWAQPLLWLAMVVPAADGSRRPLSTEILHPDGAKLSEYAARMADDLEALRDRLEFDATTGAYRVR